MKLAVAVAAAASGCVGPQVSDEPAPSGDIVAAGTELPSIDEEADDAALIAANDGVDGVVPRWSAFAAGAPTHVWDFGPAPGFAAPLFVVMQRKPDGTLAALPHPPIVGTIPGDPGYSPFRHLFALVVTDRYQGELITSTTAIEEAERDGIIEPPIDQKRTLNQPMVASDVRLDLGTATPLAPGVMLYERHTVAAFDFGPLDVARDVTVAPSPRYVLRRVGEDPLSEPVRGVDMDDDGDTLDTNDVFAHAATDAMRSPLCETVEVTVVAGMHSIDTSHDDASSDVESATQLFDPEPVAATVVSFHATGALRNFPAQRTPGGP